MALWAILRGGHYVAETGSASSASVSSAIVLVVAVFLVYGLHRAGAGLTGILGTLLVYLVVPGLLARMELLDRYDPPPPPALLLLVGLTVLTIAVIFSPLGRRLALNVGLGAVVALQTFRIPVERLLHRLYVEGVIPVQMTYEGRNFDVITGITGLLLGIWLLSGLRVPRGIVWAWNILGLLLLANIVAIAALSTPVSFRRFVEGPPNLLPSTFPFVWLPSFLVQVAFGSHLLVFRQLRLGR